MSFLLELGAAAHELGGKARSLVELAAQNCATPPGFVVADALFRALLGSAEIPVRLDSAAILELDELQARLLAAAWPAGFEDELAARLAQIQAKSYSVRSSFASEDVSAALAAGVYESRVDVAPEDVGSAIRQVLCSALAPSALAYALAHGQTPAAKPVAVLVHAYLPGEADGSAAFAEGLMTAPLIEVRRGSLAEPAAEKLRAKLGELCRVRGATEIEWVQRGQSLVYLQARPYHHPPAVATWAGFKDVQDHESWRWDRAHNPLPLSPAQAGLVELADAHAAIGIRQRVLGGYLFYRRDDRPLPTGIDCEEAPVFFASLCSRMEDGLSSLGERPALEEALSLFLSVYEPIFGVLQPALRQAQRRLRGFLEAHAPRGLSLLPVLCASVPSVAGERRACMEAIRCAASEDERNRATSRYLARFGAEAPIWDVEAKTFAEDPSVLFAGGLCEARATEAVSSWQQASAEVETMLAPALRPEWHRLLEAARNARSLGEADDWLYARAQTAVRRALLAMGEHLTESRDLAIPSDVFFLPLDEVRELARGRAGRHGLKEQARKGREAWQKASADPPPLPELGDDRVVRGIGTGGRAMGKVAHHHPGQVSATNAVLVAKTLLPTELPLIEALAIVCETGGLLDHVAAQARERGLPAVVGATGAGELLAEGALVLVDADRGLVVKLA